MDSQNPINNQVPAAAPAPSTPSMEARTSATPLKPAAIPILEVMPQNAKEAEKASTFMPRVDPYREAPAIEKNNTLPIKVESAPTQLPKTPAQAPVNLPGSDTHPKDIIGWNSGPKAADVMNAQPVPKTPDPSGLQASVDRNFNAYLGSKQPTPIQRVATTRADDGLERLRTYEGDVADAIKSQNSSVVKIAIAQQKKENKKEAVVFDSTPIKPKRNGLTMAVSIFLLIAGLAVLGGIYVYVFVINKTVPVKTTPSDLIISSDSEKEIDISSLSDSDIESKITAAEDQNLGAGAIEHIFFSQTTAGTKITINAQQFFALLGIHAPAAMIRALGNTFSFGFQNTGTLQPFIILTPESFDTVYAGMLQWEPTMYTDLQPVVNSPVSTSTTPNAQFEDAVIKNNDTRILRDSSGDPVLIYSFPDDQHLIITTNQQTLEELFTRLTTAAKIVQ